MQINFIDIREHSQLIPLGEHTFPKAESLARYLESDLNPYTTLIECRSSDSLGQKLGISNESCEVVVFKTLVEVGQQPVFPIQDEEDIAVLFWKNDYDMPEVLALREDFPQTPHINLRHQIIPRSLCLYDLPYNELKLSWKPSQFINRIKEWLYLTSKGELHQEDQPVEPLLIDHCGVVILPARLRGNHNNTKLEKITFDFLGRKNGRYFLKALTEFETAQFKKSGIDIKECAVSFHRCQPQVHGIIQRTPVTLSELDTLANNAGCNLIKELQDNLKKWLCETQGEENEQERKYLNHPLIIILSCPQKRHPNSKTEIISKWFFVTEDKLEKVGEAIGCWKMYNGNPGILITPRNNIDNEIMISTLNPIFYPCRSGLASLQGYTKSNNSQIVAIGAGALGSQVIMNMARSGFGRWIIIDKDFLLPHNLARHALDGRYVGISKAEAVSNLANTITDELGNYQPITADIINSKENHDTVLSALKEADIIIDMSASVPVSRYLVHNVESNARKVSLFLNPKATDLVLLMEDSTGCITQDALEMQYYRFLTHNNLLSNHLNIESGDQVRYGRSCNEISMKIEGEYFSIYSAIGSRAIRRYIENEEASIVVWCSDEENNINKIEIQPSPMYRFNLNKWTVIVDETLLVKLKVLRSGRLPNETGGVLVGSISNDYKYIYIVDVIPSPPDSEEWPNSYIRGNSGLKSKIQEIEKATSNQLYYIGEWHSHPDGASLSPSNDDRRFFDWLRERMFPDNMPSIMIIAGDQQINCYIDSIENEVKLLKNE